MRKWIRVIFITLLLAGGATVCVIRWQAWFGMPDEPVWTGDTLDYVFPNLSVQRSNSVAVYQSEGRSISPQDDLTILILGDIHNRLTRADYDTLAARVPNAQAIIQVGDWLERGQFYYRQLLLREWTNSALYGLPVVSCPGNHEYTKGLGKHISPIWEQTFDHPHNGPIDVPGASYYVDLPQVRCIVIDTNPLVRTVNITRTITWLRRTMNEAGDRFIVVIMHHPVLSACKGRFNPQIYAAFRHVLKDADLVLAGHDHSYMRSGHFVVLNTGGKIKPQHDHLIADVTDSVPVYAILQCNGLTAKRSNSASGLTGEAGLTFTVHRLDDGTEIDSLHVQHD